MNTMFLSLEDAVKVAVRHFDINPTLARQEFEQKCYIPNDQYEIGYYDGVQAALKAVQDVIDK